MAGHFFMHAEVYFFVRSLYYSLFVQNPKVPTPTGRLYVLGGR